MAPLSSRREPEAESVGSDYFMSEAHYRSLAQRIVAALDGDRGVVLVTSEPPASPLLLSEAINREAAARFVVIGVSGGPDLTCDGLVRAVPALAARAASLFVLDEADRLSDAQLEEVYEAVLHGDRTVAAAVLLARPGFLQRLERPGLHFLKDGCTAHFHFQQLGSDEVGTFLRRQLRLAADASALPPESLAAIADAAGGDPAVASRLAQQLLEDRDKEGAAPITPAPQASQPKAEETEDIPTDSSSERPFQLLDEPAGRDTGRVEDEKEAANDVPHDTNAAAILGSLDEISQAISDAAGERPKGTEPHSVAELAASLLGRPASDIAPAPTLAAPAAEPRLVRRPTRARRLRFAAIVCAAYLAVVAAASVAVFSVLHTAPDSATAENKREAGSSLVKAAESLLSRDHPDNKQIARNKPATAPASPEPAAAATPTPPAAVAEAALPSAPPTEIPAPNAAKPAPDARATVPTTADERPTSAPTASPAAETAPPPLPPALPATEAPAPIAIATPEPKPTPPATLKADALEATRLMASEVPKPVAPDATKPTAPETKAADAATPAPAPASAKNMPAAAAPVERPPTAPSTAAPPPAAPPSSPAKPTLSAAEIATLRARGDALLATGDIVSARLFYERAAEGGDAQAALMAGQTFDPGFLARAGVRGVRGDKAQASEWYRRAGTLGSAEADRRLKTLGK